MKVIILMAVLTAFSFAGCAKKKKDEAEVTSGKLTVRGLQ